MEDLSKKTKEAFLIMIPALKKDHCLDANLIGLHLEKKLSAGESNKVEEHINGCLFCLNQLNDLQEMIHFEENTEPLTQKQRERFSAIFQEKTKKHARIKEADFKTIFGSLQQTLQKIPEFFSFWNIGWKTAMTMLLIAITSAYFTYRTVNIGHSSAFKLSSEVTQDISRSGVKVSLLDKSGNRFRETQGVIINSNGLILTNLSDMTHAHSAEVIFKDGSTLPVEGVQPDEARNLAILKVNRGGLVALKEGPAEDLKIGENMVQISDVSNPSGTASLATVTNFISSSKKTPEGKQYVQLVNQNTSQKNGILINKEGKAIGMVISRQENLSYAVLFKPDEIGGDVRNFRPVSSIDGNLPSGGDALGFYFKGIMAYDSKDYEKAEGYLKSAIELNPRMEGAHLWLGWLYYDEGKFDLEVQQYKEALKINPKNVDARVSLAEAKDQAGLYDEAIEEFTNALQVDPRNMEALYELGVDYVLQGKIEKAKEQYEALKFLDIGNARKLKKLIEMGKIQN